MTLHAEHYILISLALWMLWVSCLASRAKGKANENRSWIRGTNKDVRINDGQCNARISNNKNHTDQGMDKMWNRIELLVKAKCGAVAGVMATYSCVCPVCNKIVAKDLKTPRQSKDVDCKGCGSKVRVQGAV